MEGGEKKLDEGQRAQSDLERVCDMMNLCRHCGIILRDTVGPGYYIHFCGAMCWLHHQSPTLQDKWAKASNYEDMYLNADRDKVKRNTGSDPNKT